MNQFKELGLSAPVVEVIRKIGFEEPTKIQAMAIPKLLGSGTDLIALAQTGTGKTAAFGLPLIDLTDGSNPRPQALILAPTRELALQISGEIKRFASTNSGLNIVTVYGGADIREQIRQLKRGAQIIVATPGRLKDLMSRKKVDLTQVRYIVLDEADEMLNMGFRPDIDHILEAMPQDRHIWLFSATMSTEVQKLSRKYLQAPLELTAGTRNVSNESIDHQYLILNRSEKYPALCRLLDFHDDFYGLLFCRTRRETQQLAEQLTRDSYAADALHGDMSQSQRERVMNKFRRRQIKILVATDVAARGIDVNDLTHVLHFNIPDDLAFYTHRSGRTGRAGKKGTSIALLTKNDLSMLRLVERRSKIKFERIQLPDASAVVQKKLNGYFKQLMTVKVQKEIHPLLEEINLELADLSKEELIARVAAQAIGKIPVTHPKKNGRKSTVEGRSKSKDSSTRLFINVGRIDGFDKAGFLRMVCEQTAVSGEHIGRIDLQDTFSHFEVETSVAGTIMNQFQDKEMQGRALRVNPADEFKRAQGKNLRKEKNKLKKVKKSSRKSGRRY